MKANYLFFQALALLLPAFLHAQTTGKVYGSINDGDNHEPLIGASVLVVETGTGAATDLDGLYEIEFEPGAYTLQISYTGYQGQEVTALEIKGGENIKLDFQLVPEAQELLLVTVTAHAKQNTPVSLLLMQQKSISIATGISADQIRQSPDRNTSDVLKRVSGASVQDNKYIVVRGLADRYNTTLINGLSLPSSEPDKRAFSFNIFPANLLDNLVIYKSATPDLPGEFAGGVTQLNTKEIPQESFASFSLSSGYNSLSTFKGFSTYQGGSTDWLGYDDGARGLPEGLEQIERDTFNKSIDNQKRYTAMFPNNWGVLDQASMMPAIGLQMSAGKSFGNFGVVGALTYNNTPRIQTGERGDFTNDGRLYQYFDTNTRVNIGLGGLLNLAYKISPRSKIQLNNTYTVSSDNQFSMRTGDDLDQTRKAEAYSYWYNTDKLFTSQLLGEHAFTSRNIKLNWGLGYNLISREVPSYRRIWYYRNFEAPADAPFEASIQPGNPSPNYAGNFFSDQDEKFYVGKLDLSIPYLLGSKKGNFKMGGLYEAKEREFDARVYGFISFFQTPQTLKSLPIDEIFDAKNLNETGFLVKDATDLSDSYQGQTELMAGYGMIEQSLSDRLRVIGGARVEQYQQTMNSFLVRTTTPVLVDTSFTDILPSLHFIFALTEKSNLRLTGARTVGRPNLREIAPFSFYDFFVERGITGNPELVRTNIWNADLRYEIYPGGAKYFAASLFYKKFENPIEQVQIPGTIILTWDNAPSAIDLGIELEGRLSLGSLLPALTDFTVFGNLSYIYSDVDIAGLGEGQLERPLFGQSPYLINLGLNYRNDDIGLSSTLLYNRIGRRIWLVGLDQDPHVWEAPRDVLDFQVSKNIGPRAELKLTVGDILNQSLNFYQDFNESGRYETEEDGLIMSNRFGTNISIGLSYNLQGK